MKKTRWLLYVVFGLVFYLLFLIVEIPASWFAWGLNRYTQGTVRLDPAAGSLWGGNGRLVIYYPQTTPHEFGQTEWRINPLWLIVGRVQLALQTSHQDRQIKTTLGIARNSFMLKDTEAAVPASFIAKIYPPASLIGPQGKVSLIASELVIKPESVAGGAVLEWQGASSLLSNVQPLGDYRLEITTAEKAVNFKLTTLSGVLELTGQGNWQVPGGQIQFNGSAKPKDRSGDLAPLLMMLGNDQGGGRRLLTLNTQLPFPKRNTE